MKRIWSSLVLFLLIAACKMETTERKITVSQPQAVRAYCVGRHFVDMPSSFSPSPVTTGSFKTAGLSAREPSIEVMVRASQLTPAQFAVEVLRRHDELSKKAGGTTDVLRLEKALNNTATLFRVQRIDDAYVSEIDFLSGSSFVAARLKSYDEKYIAAEDRLIAFAAEVKATEIVARGSDGFCLGPISISGKFDEENGSFLFRDGRGDDFGIEISKQKAGGGTALLARMSGPDSLLSRFDVRHTVLRARERTVAGVPAQEWLGWTNLGENRNEKTFGFALETMPQADGKTGTSLTLSFDSAQPLEDGARTKNFMSDEEAIQLWDSVVKSIRPVTG